MAYILPPEYEPLNVKCGAFIAKHMHQQTKEADAQLTEWETSGSIKVLQRCFTELTYAPEPISNIHTRRNNATLHAHDNTQSRSPLTRHPLFTVMNRGQHLINASKAMDELHLGRLINDESGNGTHGALKQKDAL